MSVSLEKRREDPFLPFRMYGEQSADVDYGMSDPEGVLRHFVDVYRSNAQTAMVAPFLELHSDPPQDVLLKAYAESGLFNNVYHADLAAMASENPPRNWRQLRRRMTFRNISHGIISAQEARTSEGRNTVIGRDGALAVCMALNPHAEVVPGPYDTTTLRNIFVPDGFVVNHKNRIRAAIVNAPPSENGNITVPGSSESTNGAGIQRLLHVTRYRAKAVVVTPMVDSVPDMYYANWNMEVRMLPFEPAAFSEIVDEMVATYTPTEYHGALASVRGEAASTRGLPQHFMLYRAPNPLAIKVFGVGPARRN